MKTDAFVTKSSEETQKLAKHFGENLKGGEILALFGDLGAGKTTFVQGLAKGLGIKERIISPTFLIIRKHEFVKGNFFHVDLYRIEKENISELGLIEIINDQNNIIAIEWAEKIKELLPKKRTEIYFEYVSENERKIVVKKYKQSLRLSV